MDKSEGMSSRHEISAGGVVFRRSAALIEILAIDDRFGKMSLPKGHQEAGELLAETALREVSEETGVHGLIVGAPLGTVQYSFVANGAQVVKDVHYYLIEASGGRERAQLEEIKGIRWIPLDDVMDWQKKHGYANNDEIVRTATIRLALGVHCSDASAVD